MKHEDPEFDDVVLRVLRGDELNAKEREQFDAWVAASPANRDAVTELRETWDLLGAREMIAWTAPDAAELHAAVNRRSSHVRWIRLGLAGGAVAAAIAALLLLPMKRPSEPPLPAVANVYTTNANQMRTVRLADGTLARLAQNSRLEEMQSAGERQVRLVGRAFFAVAHNPAQPFRIHAPGGNVTVLGTRFEVVAQDSVVSVVVVDGRVEVGGSRGSVQLREGQRAAVVRDGMPSRPERVDDVYAALDWMRNALVFQSTPLASVAREVEGRYGVEVVIRDPALRDRVVTAAFSDQSLDEVVAVVCSVVSVRCTIDEGANRVVIGS